MLWFDWDGHEPLYDQSQTYQIVKTLQPEIVINNRLDLGPGNNDRQILSPNADYYTPEQHVGAYDDQRPWESCMTTSRRGQWAWGGHEDGVKSLEDCLGMLIRCAGGDGNLLLNVGPMPTGEIAPEQANLLKEMGAWLAKYGESIYGTRGGPFKPGDYGVSTRQGNTIYVHICEWTDEVLTLPAIPREGAAQPGAERRPGRSSPVGGRPSDLRSGKRPPADRHHRRARTRRRRERPLGGGCPWPGFVECQRPSHRFERLSRIGPNTARTKPWTAARIPAGRPTAESLPRGWNLTLASRSNSAAVLSSRRFPN